MPITAQSRIIAGDESLQPLVKVLAGEIARVTGLSLPMTTGTAKAGDIVLKINSTIKANEPILMLRNREVVRSTEGAHVVRIDEQAIVEGFDYRATAEGTSTILQLLSKTEDSFRLPRLRIHDWPHADYCGVLLDVARQDHPMEAIQKIVELCRLYKARYLQLHLTDDEGWTFPSTAFPKLGTQNYGAHGGKAPRVYSLEALRALVAYADARGVTLVPEFEMPGHSGATARALPELFDAINPQSKQPVNIGCMNMSSENLYPALDPIIGEMCDVFRSSPYFHIGSDEVTSGRLSLHSGYQAFMAKHGLKNDEQLADYFVASVCAMVKKHGKKPIKWEGLANAASKDVIIMAWEANSNVAADVLARGYTTITCPWNLGVPWEQWNMYVCNASRLKKGDSVLGATLVAWEQAPEVHIASLRNLASRQERTWGPDNPVTKEGFAARFQPLDALAGKLIDLPPRPKFEASITTSLGTSDFLDPVFAIDGNDETFYQSARPPKPGDQFTIAFPEPKRLHAIGVLTGINRRGMLNGGEVQVSSDGVHFTTVATIDQGAAATVLKERQVQAVRLRAAKAESDPLVVRGINLQFLVALSGKLPNPAATVSAGNVAEVIGDAELAYPIGDFTAPIINRGFRLTLNNGSHSCSLGGPISGSGMVEIHAGGIDSPLRLEGNNANTMQGTWAIKSGCVVLSKAHGARALAGRIVLGDRNAPASLVWNANNQFSGDARLQLVGSDRAAASLNLNGFKDSLAQLNLERGSVIQTDGAGQSGVLEVRELVVNGKHLPRGVYTSSSEWLRGSGYVIVGDVRRVETSGLVLDPIRSIGAGNFAILKAATALNLPEGECTVHVLTGDFLLAIKSAGNKARFSGFITGNGALRIEATDDSPLELSGSASNAFKGTTTLAHGVLRLHKPANAIAIPHDLIMGGSAAKNKDDTVSWEADGQIAPSATITMLGTQTSILKLNGHKVDVSKLALSTAARIDTGAGGTLRVRQLFVENERLADAIYRAPQPWLAGTGVVVVDPRVNVQGVIGNPETVIGAGNIGNLTGDAKIAYPSSGGDFDIITNGYKLSLDSGDGNAFAYTGSISGNGNVEFFMGPSHTGFRDAPMKLAGVKPNTATGKFFVKKGRVQLGKPEGVIAISGDVVVGGQGFNDCLYWANSRQLKPGVNITLLEAGNNGAAYLHLNGCHDSAASLTMTVHNRILTDSASGKSGEFIVDALIIGGAPKPAGIYTAATEKWLEGKGQVIVRSR